MEENIIIRTEKIRGIGEALKAKNILYISAFYGSGKTVLLDQTAAVGGEEKQAHKLRRVVNGLQHRRELGKPYERRQGFLPLGP